jgi:hypothetical protein
MTKISIDNDTEELNSHRNKKNGNVITKDVV